MRRRKCRQTVNRRQAMMNGNPALMHSHKTRYGVRAALGVLFACALVLSSAMAQGAHPSPAHEPEGFFARMGRWFDQGTENFNAGIRSMRDHLHSFSQEAGVAAKTTVDNTKAAADAMARLPNTRVVHGHEKCKVAPNGAPDCVAAAVKVCKKHGFKDGSSVDMTTAEVCPAEVYLAGRNSGPGCHTETFVSRVVCR
jgi:hypothetical protein